MIFRLQRDALRVQQSSELGLNRVERLLLAIGINLACAVISIGDRPTCRSDRN